MDSMKRLLPLFVAPIAALLLLAGPTTQEAQAQAAFGGQGSWGSEADFGVGARALVNIPNVNLEFVGSAEVFFPDGDVDWFDFNANVFYHFHLPDAPSLMPYLGGGLNVARISNAASTTEAGLNLGGGIRFPGATVTPFIEGRGVISDLDQFVVTVGLLFGPTRF